MKGITTLLVLAIIIPAICIPAVTSTDGIQIAVTNVTANLTALLSDIKEKRSMGVDTTEAEAYYNTANEKIGSARTRPATQYSTAFEDLITAQASITAGETAGDKAWAERDVMNAREPLGNADRIIAFLESNGSIVNSTQLAPILAKREMAVRYLSAANNEIANGNYSGARAMAEKAWMSGNEFYTDVMGIAPEISVGPEDRWAQLRLLFSGLPVLPVAAGIGAIIAAVIVIAMRKGRK